jgi:hypothetical protein
MRGDGIAHAECRGCITEPFIKSPKGRMRQEGRRKQMGIDVSEALAHQAVFFDELQDLIVFGRANAGECP